MVDTVNQMIGDYSWQSICDNWILIAFTFILDLAAVNARTILKYNKENDIDLRRNF